MFNIFITSVTIHYLNCVMEAKCRSLRLPGSGLGKWRYPLERQSAGLMPNYSLMSTPGGTLRGLTAPSSHTVCSYMQLGRDRRKQRGSSAEEVTWPTAMQAPAEGGSYSGHLVLADDPFAEAGGPALQEEDQCHAAATAYQPFCQPEAWSRSHEQRS